MQTKQRNSGVTPFEKKRPLSIDGVVIGQTVHATGNISNTLPLTIGGKLNCDNVAITCDYFAGDIDYVTIETS